MSTKIYPFGNGQDTAGSHMPLTNDVSGWCWRNPLNLIPLGIVLMVLFSVVAGW